MVRNHDPILQRSLQELVRMTPARLTRLRVEHVPAGIYKWWQPPNQPRPRRQKCKARRHHG